METNQLVVEQSSIYSFDKTVDLLVAEAE